MSTGNLAIEVNKLSKVYRIGQKRKIHDTFGGAILDFVGSPIKNFKKFRSLYSFKDIANGNNEDILWALKDLTFKVKKGEVVGIIGKNGAGKSTLLKVLSRITSPTTGFADIYGRVGSLLEVGTGFHPELTGRENIYLNGAILGMRRDEIDRKFDEIVEFSGISQFIETPVKRYSSGMRVRVGFAVAAYLEPEILIIDEVLAVGDAEFQKKCIGKMQDVSKEGRTVLFVSHNLGAVKSLCSRGILISKGKIVKDGSVDEVVDHYLGEMNKGTKNAFKENPDRSGSGEVRFTHGRILDDAGRETSSLISGKSATIEFHYTKNREISQVFATATIYNQLGIAVASLNMEVQGFEIDSLGNRGIFTCHIPIIPLPSGSYRIAVAFISKQKMMIDHIPNALSFSVDSSVFFATGKMPPMQFSTCLVSYQWKHSLLS